MLDGPLFILSLPALLITGAITKNNLNQGLGIATMLACAGGWAFLGYRYHWAFYIPAGATVYTLVQMETLKL
jgi:uncharacterized membrane-anchored protein